MKLPEEAMQARLEKLRKQVGWAQFAEDKIPVAMADLAALLAEIDRLRADSAVRHEA